jgi:hypothetical protein
VSHPSCYLVSPSDFGVTYLRGPRVFNFQVSPHGDHHSVDLSLHLVQQGIVLGGGRYLPTIKVRDFGVCRFRLSLSEGEYDPTCLFSLIESDEFQEFANGPLDDLAGVINPRRFGALPD